MDTISTNTQAILLLTAPLILGKGSQSFDLLTTKEYNLLARYLWKIGKQPSDLLYSDAKDLIEKCSNLINPERLNSLLNRGFLLSQVIELWQSRSIWVISRADKTYPGLIKHKLKDQSPPILYGFGNLDLLNTGGLAVIGSRKIDDSIYNYSNNIGKLAAKFGTKVISGGAKGVDQAAMYGALHEGGYVCEVMAENLERAVLDAGRRNYLMSGNLILVSAYDPKASFNIGHAMQRNKLIYALSDASLVVASDFNKGGTWAGATEQLDKLKFVPVYVRLDDESKGLKELYNKGAIPWPNPQDINSFRQIFDVTNLPSNTNLNLSLFDEEDIVKEFKVSNIAQQSLTNPIDESTKTNTPAATNTIEIEVQKPADELFEFAANIILSLLNTPLKDSEIAQVLNISLAQTKLWLSRLVEEKRIEKKSKPVTYVIKQL
ncbi:DNA-processing protein DprA [Acinetobacter calcoaceticus]|uniref:DNA-processing protein DprA n=1 Tax=Acinetobacter calcoaceticus TaxID=471 RepID=UPI003AF72182